MERFEILTEGEFETIRDRTGGLTISLPTATKRTDGAAADAAHPSYDAMFQHTVKPLAVRFRLEKKFVERLAARPDSADFELEGHVLSYARHRAKSPIEVTVEPIDGDQLLLMGATTGAYAAYELKMPEGPFHREMTLCVYRYPGSCYTLNILSGLAALDPELTAFTDLVLGNLAIIEAE